MQRRLTNDVDLMYFELLFLRFCFVCLEFVIVCYSYFISCIFKA